MILSPTFSPSLLAVIGYAVAIAWPQRAEQTGPRVPTGLAAFCLLAWVAQEVAIGVDGLALDAPQAGARFGFAPALSVTSWLVLGVYALESRRLGLPVVRQTLACLAAATVVLAWVFPGRAYTASQIDAWAPLHWVTGFASYGLIGAALLHAALLTHAERRLRSGSAGSGQIPSPHRPAGQALGVPPLRPGGPPPQVVAAGVAGPR